MSGREQGRARPGEDVEGEEEEDEERDPQEEEKLENLGMKMEGVVDLLEELVKTQKEVADRQARLEKVENDLANRIGETAVASSLPGKVPMNGDDGAEHHLNRGNGGL